MYDKCQTSLLAIQLTIYPAPISWVGLSYDNKIIRGKLRRFGGEGYEVRGGVLFDENVLHRGHVIVLRLVCLACGMLLLENMSLYLLHVVDITTTTSTKMQLEHDHSRINGDKIDSNFKVGYIAAAQQHITCIRTNFVLGEF